MEVVRRVRKGQKCSFPDCSKLATDLAYDRERGKVVVACEPHAEMTADADSPEYMKACPNCGCLHGVN